MDPVILAAMEVVLITTVVMVAVAMLALGVQEAPTERMQVAMELNTAHHLLMVLGEEAVVVTSQLL
jgi:uncharacterized integral membrane protein